MTIITPIIIVLMIIISWISIYFIIKLNKTEYPSDLKFGTILMSIGNSILLAPSVIIYFTLNSDSMKSLSVTFIEVLMLVISVITWLVYLCIYIIDDTSLISDAKDWYKMKIAGHNSRKMKHNKEKLHASTAKYNRKNAYKVKQLVELINFRDPVPKDIEKMIHTSIRVVGLTKIIGHLSPEFDIKYKIKANNRKKNLNNYPITFKDFIYDGYKSLGVNEFFRFFR